ncbi:MAG: tetratricopeptide repeat protein [Syntrophobacteraceae bacterium]|nr:tetratricopeptide repeat protein [Syntrophobacteraceae bacterium]
MEPGTRIRWKRPLHLTLLLFIVLMILSSYSNTFTSPPYLDDFKSFIYPRALYLHSLSLASLLALSKTQFGWTRFLPVVTFALDHYLGHSELIYFHAVNILIHLLAFFSLFWFVGLVLAAEKRTRPLVEIHYELAGFFPLCVAAIWALSPVQTSAVTYLVQRMASMQALFFTLSAACFIKARLCCEKKRLTGLIFYFLCAFAGLCAGLSKENAAMLPVVLATIDIWFFDSAWMKKAWGMCCKSCWKVRSFAAALLVACTYYLFFVELPKILSGYGHRDFTAVQRLLTEARVVAWYMSLLLWPFPSRLSMEHDPPISTSLFSPFTTIPAILVLAAMIFLAIRFRKRFPVITFGIVWFFLNLAIESTIVPLELVFEHRLYLPSMGFYLSVAAVFAILLRKAARRLPEVEFAKAACSLLLLAAAGFAMFTFLRNAVWENPLTIRYDTVKKAPGNPRAMADYANTLCEAGQYEEALKYAQRALKIGKKGHEADGLAQNAIAIALLKLNKPEEAIERSEKFLEAKAIRAIDADAIPDVCLNVVQACLMENKPKEACNWALKALQYVRLTDEGSLYKKELVEKVLVEIFSRFDVKQIDPSLETIPEYAGLKGGPATGPSKGQGSLPVGHSTGLGTEGGGVCGCSTGGVELRRAVLLTAMEFKTHSEPQYARQMLEREYAKDPDDRFLKSEIASFRKEDAQNLAQKKYWNAFDKYVRSPFSRFRFDMAVAYLVQQKSLPRFFQVLGENRLNAALMISPGSSSALLLKGWYLFSGDHADLAVESVRKVLAAEPQNSNGWLALGFFLAKAGNSTGAVSAFEMVAKLYPGYPQMSVVKGLCLQLKTGGRLIESALRKK